MVKNDGCQASIPSFSGQLGFYIKGSVSPPLSGVHVRILASGDSQIAQLKNGELVLETTTVMDGSFVGGPLYNDISYNVEASKVWNDSSNVIERTFLDGLVVRSLFYMTAVDFVLVYCICAAWLSLKTSWSLFLFLSEA